MREEEGGGPRRGVRVDPKSGDEGNKTDHRRVGKGRCWGGI